MFSINHIYSLCLVIQDRRSGKHEWLWICLLCLCSWAKEILKSWGSGRLYNILRQDQQQTPHKIKLAQIWPGTWNVLRSSLLRWRCSGAKQWCRGLVMDVCFYLLLFVSLDCAGLCLFICSLCSVQVLFLLKKFKNKTLPPLVLRLELIFLTL